MCCLEVSFVALCVAGVCCVVCVQLLSLCFHTAINSSEYVFLDAVCIRQIRYSTVTCKYKKINIWRVIKARNAHTSTLEAYMAISESGED